MTSKTYKLLVYGCQGNVSDAERMAGALEGLGYRRTEDMEKASLILMNTCCVRETAEDKAYGKIGEIKRLKRENPALIFGVAGCMAQKEGERLIKRAPHIDFVLGTGQAADLPHIVERLERERAHIVATEMTGEVETAAPVRSGGFSAWVPIMYGCNNFCTYCIVPYVRGRERSREAEDILAEVRDAAARGYREVTLLGQNVNSYGKDLKKGSFPELLRRVDEAPGIERVRFMTSHPKDLSPELIEVIAEGRHICHHIHLPVQHGSTRILKAMNRVYTADAYRELVSRIRKRIPGVSLTTDLIVGFPGETEADFEELLDFLREIRFDAAYTFIYSPRSGTPAARFKEQVEARVKHERLQRLMDLQNKISLEINQTYLGKTVEVMCEGASKHDSAVWTGRTGENKLVLFPHGGEREGDIIRVKITQPQTWLLKGEVMS